MSDGFFWFDPFGAAPTDAEVSGTAGGPISWGGAPSWPFERQEVESSFLSLVSLATCRSRAPRHEPHFQFFTDRDPDAPSPAEEYARVEWKRSVELIRIAPGKEVQA